MAMRGTVKVETKDLLEKSSHRLGQIKRQQEKLKIEREQIKDIFWKYFDQTGEKVFEDPEGYRVMRSESVSVALQPEELEERLDERVWKKITVVKRIIDDELITRALADGLLPTDAIEAATLVKKSYALLRNPIKEEKEEKPVVSKGPAYGEQLMAIMKGLAQIG